MAVVVPRTGLEIPELDDEVLLRHPFEPRRAELVVGAAVTGDAAHLVLALLVQSGEVGWLGRPQALELLVVEMAGNAEPVVALLGSEPGEEKQDKEGSADEASERQRPASRERTNGLRASLLNALQRTVTVTGRANMTREEGPAGPPRGSTTPVGVVTVPTEDARSVP